MSAINDIDAEIERLTTEYDLLSSEYQELTADASRKRDAYDLAKARAMLKSPQEYKVDEKRAHVVEVCQQQASECHIAEATRDWAKERLRALAGLLTAQQSRLNVVRDEMRNLGAQP